MYTEMRVKDRPFSNLSNFLVPSRIKVVIICLSVPLPASKLIIFNMHANTFTKVTRLWTCDAVFEREKKKSFSMRKMYLLGGPE